MNDCRPHRERIAEGPTCHVEQCSCGVLHLTIGALTLRLEPAILASLWATLGDAVHHLSPPIAPARERCVRGDDLPS